MSEKDLLIVESDTFSLPAIALPGGLYNYYKDTTCLSNAPNRDYQAHWKLENDSLFLIKIISKCYRRSDLNPSKYIVFEEKLFALWSSNKLKLPLGNELYCYTCYYPLYEEYKIIEFNKGVVISKVIKSNLEEVTYHLNQDKVEKVKGYLIDSLGQYLDSEIDSSVWYYLDCDFTYILFFDKKGRLYEVEYEDMKDIYPEDKKCLVVLKKALKKFRLSNFSLPDQNFGVQLDIWHFKPGFDISNSFRNIYDDRSILIR